jgi:hypothetical protein
VKTHHRLPPGQLLVDPEDIDDNIARNCDNIATIADERAALSVERHYAIAAGQDCAETLASKKRCRFERNGLELGASGSRHHCHCKSAQEGDDQHHRHHFDEREAGLSARDRGRLARSFGGAGWRKA